MRLSGSEAEIGPSDTGPTRGPVASTSCLVVLLLTAFVALVVLPLSLWLLGIACGGA
jgi:hypothetical protein